MLAPEPRNSLPETGSKVWVEITVENPEEINAYIGQIDAPIEESIFAKGPEDFVKLEDVRWREDINDFEFGIVRQVEQPEEYGDCLYIKKRKIVFICPIRPDSDLWGDA